MNKINPKQSEKRKAEVTETENKKLNRNTE